MDHLESLETHKEEVRVLLSFTTEKGSVYTYNPDGSGQILRKKYDGSVDLTRGVTVFIEDADQLEVAQLYADQTHRPREFRTSPMLMEDMGTHGEFVTDVSKVRNPSNLVVALINANNQLVRKCKATLTPAIGAYPFQQTIKGDRVVRHLGDKIVSVDDRMTIRLLTLEDN